MKKKHSKIDFIIVGAQKAGTTWLWSMLSQHPETSLPTKKEIHFFGSAELYSRGKDWYYKHFENLDNHKIIGEASTTYLYDRVPFWYNNSRKIEFDQTLPVIPELISQEIKDVKIIVSLRDPVSRAISAYHHWMKRGDIAPPIGIKKVAKEFPKMRILELGYYEEYLSLWKKYIPADRLKIIIFEDEIVKNYDKTLVELYKFLGLSSNFKPNIPQKPVHKSWTWSRILFKYYTKRFSVRFANSRAGVLFDYFDLLGKKAVKREDIEFLRNIYLPRKSKLEKVVGRSLNSMKYGENYINA